MSSPDDILNSESNRCSPSDTQKKDESATQDTLKEALEDVLKHQISLARELIFSATLAGRNPKSISFHHIINRLMTILQLQVGFVVLKKGEKDYELVYISNTDSKHRETIGKSTTAAIASHSKSQNVKISLTDDSNTDAKPFDDVFYPIFNTDYFIGVLKCLKKGEYDFEWIYRIDEIENVKNGWDVAGYKMQRILMYEEKKDKYIGNNFYTTLQDALDHFSEELSHKNGYTPKNALEQIENSKQDFCDWLNITSRDEYRFATQEEVVRVVMYQKSRWR